MEYFNQAYEKRELIFAGNGEKFGTRSGFNQLKRKLWTKNWVVDIEDPIDRPENVLEYVGRYTHRVDFKRSAFRPKGWQGHIRL